MNDFIKKSAGPSERELFKRILGLEWQKPQPDKQNDNPSQFNIRIEIKHCLFGTTFTQVGVFRETQKEQRETDFV